MNWAVAFGVARRFWWAIPITALAIALHFTRTTLADRTATLDAERVAWTREIEHAEKQRAEDQARWAQQSSNAWAIYAGALADRRPLILKSTDTVREYAQTDAGRVLCRAPDRVRSIDELDASLAQRTATPATGGGTQAVHAEPAAPPAGR